MAVPRTGAYRRARVPARAATRAVRSTAVVALLAALGPGLLAMAGDNDAGGLLAYATTGARFGAGAFVLLLLPLALGTVVVQDMALRLGAVTRRGLAALVRARQSRLWALVLGADLGVQNWLTLITEFAGMGTALAHFGVPLPLGVGLSLLLVLGLVLVYPYRRVERLGVALGVASLLFVPLAAGAVWRQGPSVWLPRAGADPRLFLVAAAGNALAPWMPFFQVDATAARAKGAPPAEAVARGRLDLGAGAAVQVVVAAALLVLGAAGVTAPASRGPAGDLFAIGLFDAGLVAALTVSYSTAWTVLEILGGPAVRVRRARGLDVAYALGLTLAAAAVLLPGTSPATVAVLVQAASAVLLPPVVVVLLRLCNDPAVMPAYRNTPLGNAAAGAVLALLVAAAVWLFAGRL